MSPKLPSDSPAFSSSAPLTAPLTQPLKRRQFLVRTGAAGAGAALTAQTASGQTGSQNPERAQNAQTASRLNAQLNAQIEAPVAQPNFFTAEEYATIEHLSERIFPHDEAGPGARELGVARFIDGQMSTPYGHAARWYMKEPFVTDGPPEAGYQLPYAPRQLYRLALKALDAHCRTSWNAPFAALPPQTQDTVLSMLEKNEVALGPVPGATFFEILRANTLEGVFADPVYGGNHRMDGWKMMGFPGARADFMVWVNQEGAPYPLGPVSMPVRPRKKEG